MALGLVAARSQLTHILPPIALERGPTTPGGDRDEIDASVGVAQRTTTGCTGEEAKQVVLREVLGVDRKVHRCCSCGEREELKPTPKDMLRGRVTGNLRSPPQVKAKKRSGS